jgi:hypothetical protein
LDALTSNDFFIEAVEHRLAAEDYEDMIRLIGEGATLQAVEQALGAEMAELYAEGEEAKSIAGESRPWRLGRGLRHAQ